MTTTDSFRITATGTQGLSVSRSFAHPPERVMQAHLDAAMARVWLSSEEYPLTECRIDARPGGQFRYVWATEGGEGLAMTGAFLEIGPRHTEHTESFQPDWTGGPTRVHSQFLDDGTGGTALRVEVIYRSRAARDGAAASGMGQGMAESYARLDGLLAGG